MRVRVRGGTVNHGEPSLCSSCRFSMIREHPSLWHMEEIAWVLRSSPNRKTVGFIEARRLKDDERHVLEE
jgi:hypothetical protein